MKRCSKCKIEKDERAFSAQRRSRDKLQAYCKSCATRDNQRRQYGILPEQYDAMLVAQDGSCAICHQKCTSGKRLAVDHEHSTGKVRGLLCGNCNHAIGKLHERPEWLRNAADYIDTHTFEVIQ